MQKIQWTENLKLDIHDIDEQHMKFLDIINEIMLATEEKRSKDIQSKIIEEQISYVFYHFSKEERYFSKANYSGASEHEEEYESFIDKVIKFKKDFDKNKITLSIEMINFMNNWWVNHIRISNKKYQLSVTKSSV